MPNLICSSCGNVWGPAFKFCPLDGFTLIVGPADAVVPDASPTAEASAPVVVSAPPAREPSSKETWTFGGRPSLRSGMGSRPPEIKASRTARHARVEPNKAVVARESPAARVEPQVVKGPRTARHAKVEPQPARVEPRAVAATVDARPAPGRAPASPTVGHGDVEVRSKRAQPGAAADKPRVHDTHPAPDEARPPAPRKLDTRPPLSHDSRVALSALDVPPAAPSGPRLTRLKPESRAVPSREPIVPSTWASYPEPVLPRRESDPLDLSFAAERAPADPRLKPPTETPATRPATPHSRASPEPKSPKSRRVGASIEPANPQPTRAQRAAAAESSEARSPGSALVAEAPSRRETTFHDQPTVLHEPRAQLRREHSVATPVLANEESTVIFVEDKQRGVAAFSDTAWFKRPLEMGAVDPDTGRIAHTTSTYARDPRISHTQRRRFSLRSVSESTD